MNSLSTLSLEKYCLPNKIQYLSSKLAIANNFLYSQGMLANAYFFGHPIWAKKDFQRETHNHFWKSRWQKVIKSWDDKVVVDIGCGFGHVLETISGNPALIIGIDISLEALKHAEKLGYTPLLADAQNLPLKSGFADIVTLNATLHHCDDVASTLKEAARLVKPGGLLITDLDPQKTAWDFKGLGLLLNQARRRFPMYWLMRFARYRSRTEINMRLATELHNAKSGDGLMPQVYHQILKPLGFQVNLYPHNHNIDDEIFTGRLGHLPRHYQLIQWLSGIQSNQRASAQSIMCVARSPLSKEEQ